MEVRRLAHQAGTGQIVTAPAGHCHIAETARATDKLDALPAH